MRLRMNKLAVGSVITAIMLTGCATVDLNEMATPSVATTSQDEVNVVERAVTKLNSTFYSKGLVAKTSRKRMNSAAKILLNGLEEKRVTSVKAGQDYASVSKPVSVILDDIQLIQLHIGQTTKAAEIYLEMAPADRKLRDELNSLETALLASNHAAQVFETALNGQAGVELQSLNEEIDRLRSITNEFEARVRLQQSQKFAQRSL